MTRVLARLQQWCTIRHVSPFITTIPHVVQQFHHASIILTECILCGHVGLEHGAFSITACANQLDLRPTLATHLNRMTSTPSLPYLNGEQGHRQPAWWQADSKGRRSREGYRNAAGCFILHLHTEQLTLRGSSPHCEEEDLGLLGPLPVPKNAMLSYLVRLCFLPFL